MKATIQVVENPDRFHVSLNGQPYLTFLFSVNGSIGVSKAYALMNANSEAYKLAVKIQNQKTKVVLLETAQK